MAKNLVIVESPAKGKTIEKFLWPDYKVVASMGHIRDLPGKNLGIDIENDFEPTYEISDDKTKTVNGLKKLAKESNEVWIATDEDREWEAIGWHLCAALKLDPKKTKRIVFHEITKKAITHAVENSKTLDLDLVDAQQARRLLDRLVWFKVSPVLWKKIRKGLSAGRVQSVAVKLIVEKEKEISNFKPEESWKLSVELSYSNSRFKAELHKVWGKVKKFKNKEDVIKFISTLYSSIEDVTETKNKKGFIELEKKGDLEFKLIDSVKKDSKRKPWAPFTTSTLQQEGSRKFGFWVKQTMMVAQKLYEAWFISYMRTDSVNLSDEALKTSKEVIEKNWGASYHTKRSYTTKTSGAQEAHEAIRPTDISRIPESLKWDLDATQLKVYTLIWKRTVASQMSEAVVEVTTFSFSPTVNDNSEWKTKWEVIKFDWFMKLYIESKDDDELEDNAEWVLPNIELNELLTAKKLDSTQTFSRPPARYTEASLVKKMEWEWIGRPSTYAPTIDTIINRWYVEKFDKRYLKPTETAFTVTEFLEKYFPEMMEYKFTKKVEEDFDKIAEWKNTWRKMLKSFWEDTLKKDLENAWENAEKVVENVWRKCPECKEELVYRYSKAWKFAGCSGYPDCTFIEKDKEKEAELDELRAKYDWKPCPDGIEWTVVVKTGRYWPFLTSSEYPKVKWIGKIKSEKDEILEQILEEKWLLIDEESWEQMVVKGSRRWPFLAAANYPAVKIAKNIPKDVWDEVNKKLEGGEEN
jgi:DNA topoisomerase I